VCFVSMVKTDFQHIFFTLFIASGFGGEVAFLHSLNTPKDQIKEINSAVPHILKLSG